MVKTSKTQIIFEIEELGRNGQLNQENVELINNMLETNKYDFQVRYIQHNYPYFSYYVEIVNIADFSALKCKSKDTFAVYDKNRSDDLKSGRILIISLQDIISTLKNIDGDQKQIRKVIRAVLALVGPVFFPLRAKADNFSFYKQQSVIEQINKNGAANSENLFVKDSGSFGLPGASGFPDPSLPKRKPHAIPRMRGRQAPDGMRGLGDIPRQFF